MIARSTQTLHGRALVQRDIVTSDALIGTIRDIVSTFWMMPTKTERFFLEATICDILPQIALLASARFACTRRHQRAGGVGRQAKKPL
jgi:hypothetical protein